MKYQITVIDDSPDSILAGDTRLPVTIRRRNVDTFEVVQADNKTLLGLLKYIDASGWKGDPEFERLWPVAQAIQKRESLAEIIARKTREVEAVTPPTEYREPSDIQDEESK